MVKKPEKSLLHWDLTHSLGAIHLRNRADNARMKKIIHVLNEDDTKIPENDEAKVLKFQLKVIELMPAVKSAPGNGSFIELCLRLDKLAPQTSEKHSGHHKK